MIKVMIVEDSPTTAEYIKFVLESAGGFEVIPVATDGEKAVSQVTCSKPDVILMDINMPRMNGFEATRAIMETNPVPIVIFSASWDPEDVKKTFQAMEAGALAVLEKPPGPGSPRADKMTQELVRTLRLMSEVPVVRRTTQFKKQETDRGHARRMKETASTDAPKLVAIGASTGGPPALHKTLSMLPGDFPAPIMIVQHISVGFLTRLATWLDASCAIKVQVGRHRDLLEPGHAYLAPDKLHMGVTGGGTIALSDAAPEHNIRPSVSHLFRSVALEYGGAAAGILLTGMGRDGAQELGDIKKRGGVTIAQDEETSVVHGMPGEAIKLGNAAIVQSPEEIGETLKRLVIRQ
jgi:two-component system, chemotaxis family, protein-glutamate methylesterase/glutaminase